MLVHWLVVWSLKYNSKTLFCNPPVLLCKRCPASTQQQLQHNTTSFWWEDGEYFCCCVSALKSAKCCLSEQNLPVADVREHVLKRKGENSESASEGGRVSCEYSCSVCEREWVRICPTHGRLHWFMALNAPRDRGQRRRHGNCGLVPTALSTVCRPQHHEDGMGCLKHLHGFFSLEDTNVSVTDFFLRCCEYSCGLPPTIHPRNRSPKPSNTGGTPTAPGAANTPQNGHQTFTAFPATLQRRLTSTEVRFKAPR